MVGGVPMYPSKNIIGNAVTSKAHTMFVAAIKAAGTSETLIKPENKGTLTTILTYHVVTGKLSAADIVAKSKAVNGTATLTPVQGGILKAPFKLYMIKVHQSTQCKRSNSKTSTRKG